MVYKKDTSCVTTHTFPRGLCECTSQLLENSERASSSGCSSTVATLLFYDVLDKENATWRTTADVENVADRSCEKCQSHHRCGWD